MFRVSLGRARKTLRVGDPAQVCLFRTGKPEGVFCVCCSILSVLECHDDRSAVCKHLQSVQQLSQNVLEQIVKNNWKFFLSFVAVPRGFRR